jgi:cation diffusion facilitator CzcD-associated flavoprotein CzcO
MSVPAATNGNRPAAQAPLPEHVRVAIVGAGFAGLGTAIRLLERGEHDLVVLERDTDVGGTWWQNTYPGCQCDVPSILYSFSFAQNPEWSRTFPVQPELRDYLLRCADEFGVRPFVRTRCEVTGAEWDPVGQHWRLQTSQGELTADVVVAGTGGLSEPAIPDLPGLGRFGGPVFHSARWDHSVDLAGKRVAVVGTGASAIQFVPEIQPQVERLHLFQRTPAWIMPHTDRPTTRLERALYRRFPAVQRLIRSAVYWARETFVLGFSYDRRIMRVPQGIARRHLHRQIADPGLRAKLTPDYEIGCKRILLSNDYLPALAKPNVELVTDGIAEVRERSILAGDGSEREVDAIVLGTGFHVTDPPLAAMVRGRDGRTMAETWADDWEGSAQAHRGTAVPGFPNLFLITGPNTGLGHTSMIVMIEAQIAYILGALERMRAGGIGAMEVRPEVVAAENAALQGRLRDTVWVAGGCSSWYLDQNGRATTIWPDFTFRFRRLLRRFDAESYRLEPAREREPVSV